MTKRELSRQLSELNCTIQHIKSGNQVVIDRVYNRWGITLNDLMKERFDLIHEYNRRFGKRFGCLNYIQ
jgi:hypothetical protein